MSMFRNLMMMRHKAVDTSNDHIGVKLLDGRVIPYSKVPTSGYPKEEVVGITYRDGGVSFCIALDDIADSVYFCGGGYLENDPEGVVVSATTSEAVQDLSGDFNSHQIIQELVGNTSLAVFRTMNYTFPDGTPAYLGSIGEYRAIIYGHDKKDIVAINDLLVRCGGTAIKTQSNYWSSTLNSFDEESSTRWVWIWNGTGYIDGGDGQGLRYCRPLCVYEPDRSEDELRLSLVDAWIFSGLSNSDAPAFITGEMGFRLKCYGFSWNEEGSGFKDGRLCFNGVHDYLSTNSIPLLNDYTVIVNRKTDYSQSLSGYRYLIEKHNLDDANTGEFMLERWTGEEAIRTLSYSEINDVATDVELDGVTWQTPTSYNGIPIKRGTSNKSSILNVAWHHGDCLKTEIKWIALYATSLTPEQISSEVAKLEAMWEERKTW